MNYVTCICKLTCPCGDQTFIAGKLDGVSYSLATRAVDFIFGLRKFVHYIV